MTSRRKTLVISILAIAIVLTLGLWARVGAPEIRVLFSPIVRFLDAPGRWVARTASQNNLQKEVERLRTLVGTLAVEKSELVTLRNERDALAALVGYQEHQAVSLIPARVSAHARDPFTQAFFIDRGREQGVTERAPVVMGSGLLVGTVERVWNRSALVLVATDRKSKIPAEVLGRDGSLGVLEGHGVLYHLTLVPVDVSIQSQDLVITAPLGDHIPRGLVIGTVSGVAESEGSPFKTVLVTPIEPFMNLTWVAVLAPLQSEEL